MHGAASVQMFHLYFVIKTATCEAESWLTMCGIS
jgi:hypothetical protein